MVTRARRAAPVVMMIRAARVQAATAVRPVARVPSGAMIGVTIAAMTAGPPPARTGGAPNVAAR
jgi:hypothetical protein